MYDEHHTPYQTLEKISRLAQQQAAELAELLERYRQHFGALPEEQ